MVRVKICGITCVEDALAAVSYGADALGFVFAPSPRQVKSETVREIVDRLPALVMKVGVFVDATHDELKAAKELCGLDLVQLHGNEAEAGGRRLGPGVIRALRVGNGAPLPEDAFPSATLLLDTYSPHALGGTGRTFDWNLAAGLALRRPIILAGGLTPENVAEAVRAVRPYGVDVSSGVEKEPGRKDHDKLERFIIAAKSV
jgi:phosphoribosylanthranilate isomerase